MLRSANASRIHIGCCWHHGSVPRSSRGCENVVGVVRRPTYYRRLHPLVTLRARPLRSAGFPVDNGQPILSKYVTTFEVVHATQQIQCGQPAFGVNLGQRCPGCVHIAVGAVDDVGLTKSLMQPTWSRVKQVVTVSAVGRIRAWAPGRGRSGPSPDSRGVNRSTPFAGGALDDDVLTPRERSR